MQVSFFSKVKNENVFLSNIILLSWHSQSLYIFYQLLHISSNRGQLFANVGSSYSTWLLELMPEVVLIRLAIYLFVNKAIRGGSPKIFIHTQWCHNYMRLGFHSFEFVIWGSLKAIFIHFLMNKNIHFFFNNLRTNMLKMKPIKFHSK